MMVSVAEGPPWVCLGETLAPDHRGSLSLALGGILMLWVCEGHRDGVMLCVSEWNE